MAVVVYKCDTCEREIEKPQNVDGLEVISRCVITLGCRGKLYQVDYKQDFIRGRNPEPVAGLDDWFKRKALYNHTQTIEANTWTVTHNMGIHPSVQVFVEVGGGELVEAQPSAINIISPDKLEIEFGKDDRGLDIFRTGVAQLIARSTRPISDTAVDLVEEEVPFIQISNFGSANDKSVWTLATRSDIYPASLPIEDNPGTTTFVVTGDYTRAFVADVQFTTTDGGNSQIHTVVSSTYNSGSDETTITVQDTIVTVGDTLAEITMLIEVTYIGQKTNTNIVNVYDVPPSVLTQSAWFGVDQIVAFTQTRYEVRGFDIQFEEMNAGRILDGTPFYISQINGVTPAKRESIVLLANSPFESFDRITEKYIDVAAVTASNAASNTYFSEGVLFASNNVVSNIYPFIQTV